ncbi:hypothetical protein HY68_32640, partial [Streptomyces sp. AcH 505]
MVVGDGCAGGVVGAGGVVFLVGRSAAGEASAADVVFSSGLADRTALDRAAGRADVPASAGAG